MKESILNKYRKMGWKFTSEEYVDHHKGTDEEFEYAQSPRTKSPFMFFWKSRHNDIKHDWATEKGLISSEKDAYISQLLNDFGVEKKIHSAISKAIKPGAKEVTFTITLP